MTNSKRFLILGIAALFLSETAAQEKTRIDPQDIEDWVSGADSIVIGTFRTGFPLPWFDGWHYQSQIDVTEQLIPRGTTKTLPLPWVRPYVVGCLICQDWRPLDGQSGIWFLQKRNGSLRFLGGTTGWCSAPLHLRYLDSVKVATKRRIEPKN
jgi:hypothetical protein